MPERTRRVLSHPIVISNAIVTVVYLLANALFPAAFFDMRAWKEGPIEQLSHAVLLVAVVAWIWAVTRQRSAARTIAFGVALYTTFLMLEEIDYGLIYDLDIGLERWLGLPSLHQSQWRPRYFWEDKLYWIGTPLLLYFLLPRAPKIGVRMQRFQPVLPRFEDTVAFFVVLATFFLVDLFVKKTISTYQCVMYALLAHQGFLSAKHPPAV